MSRITWDALGERLYEVGLDHGVLYLPYLGDYINGIPWNGLTAVTAEQGGRDSSGLYRGQLKTGNVYAPQEFGGAIKAYTYPEEFEKFFGEEEFVPGVIATGQQRERFGFSYRTLRGNDSEGTSFSYKIHVVYNVEIVEVSRTYETIADSLDLEPMEWKYECFPLALEGHDPVAEFVFDSTRYDPATMQKLEKVLYGTEDSIPRLPSLDEIQSLFFNGLFPSDSTYPSTLRYYRGAWFMERSFTKPGVYAASNDNVDGYSTVTVDVYKENKFLFSLPNIGLPNVNYFIPIIVETENASGGITKTVSGFSLYIWKDDWIHVDDIAILDP